MLGTKEERRQWRTYQKFVKEHEEDPTKKFKSYTVLKYNKLYGYIWIPNQKSNPSL